MAHSDADLDALALRVAQTLLTSGRTLVTAESCSGGWIGKVCTDIPGSSAWFRGGAIVYDNALKVAVLGVPAEVLANDGAVSEPAVRQMARGALEVLGGDFSLAVSGIAGPDGGTPEKPVGTVWFAWGARGPDGMSVRAEVRHLPGDREAVRRATVAIALQGLIQA